MQCSRIHYSALQNLTLGQKEEVTVLKEEILCGTQKQKATENKQLTLKEKKRLGIHAA